MFSIHSKLVLSLVILVSADVTLGLYTEEQLSAIPPVNYELAEADRDDVVYVLFTTADDNGVRLNETNVTSAEFDRSLPTKLIFHGFTTDMTSPWYVPLKNAYFRKGPHNVFFVDWSKAGNLSFFVSAANVDPVGEFVADFLIATRIPSKNVHLIGHSLGSQLTGFIGKYTFKKTGQKIGRITALDPAGPAFDKTPKELRLNDTDADFVDVVHTDYGYYGFTQPFGHVDFYPNGGKHQQPGCPSRKDDDNCSHARSTLFFIESVTNTTAKAKEAVFNGKTNQISLVEGGKEVVFGDGVSTTARGVFHLATGSVPPFLALKTTKL